MEWNSAGSVEGVILRSLPQGSYEVSLQDGSTRLCFAGSTLRKAGIVPANGDRVAFGPDESRVFRGEITRVQREARRRPAPAEPRASLLGVETAERLQPRDQRINRAATPSWPTVAECPQAEGAEVCCTAGFGTLTRVLGRTGDGSRLLELRLAGGGRGAFYAAASNVLVAPRGARATAASAAVIGLLLTSEEDAESAELAYTE